MAALLALVSGLLWGAADFGGGLAARRWPPVAVVAWSQLAGLAALLAAVAVLRPQAHGNGWAGWAVAAGSCGALGLVSFYRALSIGTMGVVAPIAAVGAVVPVLIAIAGGERPHLLQAVGIAGAIAGAVATSGPELGSGGTRAGARSVLLAAFAGAMFGLATSAIAHGAQSSPLLTLTGMRAFTVTGFALAALVVRSVGGVRATDLRVIAPVGLADAGANLLFSVSTTMGMVSVVAVLGGLYPVSTVLLGRVVLGERLRPVQLAGVGLVLVSVAVLTVA